VLSERQMDILRIIYDHETKHGFVPTIREIGEATGIRSTSAVSYQLLHLINHGYLVKEPGLARAYRLTSTSLALFTKGNCSDDTNLVALRDEVQRLKIENERLRLEHKTKVAALLREYANLANEIHLLRQARKRYPA
jgi:SOS-response transcriptional repressor LexA